MIRRKELNNLFSLFNKKEKNRILFIFFLMLINALLELASVGILPLFISVISDKNYFVNKQFYFFSDVNLDQNDIFLFGSLLIIFIFLIKNLFQVIILYFQQNILQKFHIRITKDLFYSYLIYSWATLLLGY